MPRYDYLFPGANMDAEHDSLQTDQQLETILYDTCQWAVAGQGGQSLGFAESLRKALDRAADFATSGVVVTALTRHPFANIFVLPDQIARLRKIVAGREIPPIELNGLDDTDFEPWRGRRL